MQTYTEHEVPSGWGLGVWVPIGPLRTGKLLRFPKGWEAPGFCLPSLLPSAPSFTFLGICRAQMGAPGVLRAPLLPAGASRHSRRWGGWGRVVKGVWGAPRAKGGWGDPLDNPGSSSGQEPRPARAPRCSRPRGGVHTELLRFMRPRKADRLCRPVDTELMAERCAPLHRQRCEGVSL